MFFLGDGDIVNNMYEFDSDLLVGESVEDEIEESIMFFIFMGSSFFFFISEDFIFKEGSSYEVFVYIFEDIFIFLDFEFREFFILGVGLGIWVKKKMEIGERFGFYMVAF